MSNQLLSLTEIFNQKFFRIPDYQRGYSWGKSQLNDFWEDLENLQEGRTHYTGLLTVELLDENQVDENDRWLLKKAMKGYHLIDGQQRLTTSIVLINEILVRVQENASINFDTKENWIQKFLFQMYDGGYKSYVFGYKEDNPSDEFFKTKILGQEEFGADSVPEETLYTANLEYAKNFFSSKLKELTNEELELFFQKVSTQFKFNFYEIDNDLDVYVTFETMNNRGKPLSTLELLKNRLIYLSTLLKEENLQGRLRDDINQVWKTVYEYLGKKKGSVLEDDDFLKNHWIMYFEYNRKESGVFTKFLLNKHFTAKRVIAGEIELQDIQEYIKSLQKSVKAWFYIFNPEEENNYSDEQKEWLQKLNRIEGVQIFRPLIMAILMKTEKKDANIILEILKQIERFVFLVFKLSQRQANTADGHFYRKVHEYYYSNMGLEDVSEDIKKEIEYWFDKDKFINQIQDLFKNKDGFYDWKGLRYFLFEYELYQQENARGNQKISWQDFKKRNKEDSIEHIYPQNSNKECWNKHFGLYSEEEKLKLCNTLGNLVPLSQKKNSSLHRNLPL